MSNSRQPDGFPASPPLVDSAGRSEGTRTSMQAEAGTSTDSSAGATTGAARPFSITASLPKGTVLIEASAGTGKTWTLAALVARFVAEDGLDLDQLLVVTFSRSATQELRERVRSQLEFVLRRLGGPALEDDDALVTHLRSADSEELARRRARLTRALATFDSATVATIHQFCHLVLKGLGVAGDSDPYAQLIEEGSDLRNDVISDLYLRYAMDTPNASMSYERAQQIGAVALENATVPLGNVPPAAGLADEVAFAERVRREYERRKRRGGLLEYNDLLAQLRDAVTRPDSPAADRMRRRWSVVLVDEFQDTDPVQWEIFHTVFGSGAGSLILVGDPKQAIYAFRGGDVQTYLKAASVADRTYSLPKNYRSDPALVSALSRFMGGVELSEGIVVQPVSPFRKESRLDGAAGAPIEVRWWDAYEPGVQTARNALWNDVAQRTVDLLCGDVTFNGSPLQPHHLAILCGTHAQLQAAREALRHVGVPAVLVSGESVLRTNAGAWWLQLLEAIESPHRQEMVRAACLTPLLGWSPEELDAAASNVSADPTLELINSLRRTFEAAGVPGVTSALRGRGLAARLLGRVGGERDLTDVDHCAQVLAARAPAGGNSIASLVAWLRDQTLEDAKATADTRLIRLDTDAQAVTLTTIHASKGLQYPIVFAPTLWDRHDRKQDTPAVRHTAAGRELSFDEREVNSAETKREHTAEELRKAYVAMTRAQSKLVLWWMPSARNTSKSALTHLLFGQGDCATIHTLISRRLEKQQTNTVEGAHHATREPAPTPTLNPDFDSPVKLITWQKCPPPDQSGSMLHAWSQHPNAPFTVHPVNPDPPTGQYRPVYERADLNVSHFDRSGIDRHWRRTSYSALSAAAQQSQLLTQAQGFESVRGAGSASAPHVAPTPAPSGFDDAPANGALSGIVGSEPDAVGKTDELDLTRVADASVEGDTRTEEDTPTQARRLSPMADMPMGATFGSLVHAVLENADFQHPQLSDHLRAIVHDQLLNWPVEVDVDELVEALVSVCTTALGPSTNEMRLVDLSLQKRFSELDFELPLAGGDRPRGLVPLAELAAHLESLPDGDPIRPYANELRESAIGEQTLRGYLTGSIDLTFEHDGKFFVVDYKTNWLGDPESDLTLAEYAPQRLVEAMNHSSYPLQAILYSVVLHRYLRWRLPEYDPERHLGGVLYLYVRGMAGPDTPRDGSAPYGVFSWQPPADLVIALSDALRADPVGQEKNA